ncbi:hypothetical protein [Clostridium butyricum]
MEKRFVEESIIEKLNKYLKMNYEELSDKEKERLYKIELFIQDNNKRCNELISELKQLKLTKVSISNTKEIGLSRKTLYNDKVIQKYIEKSIIEQKDYINNDKLSDLQNKYDELKEQYKKIINNIIEVNVLNEKIEEYEERISSLTEQNEVLRKIALENRKNTSKIRSINK